MRSVIVSIVRDKAMNPSYVGYTVDEEDGNRFMGWFVRGTARTSIEITVTDKQTREVHERTTAIGSTEVTTTERDVVRVEELLDERGNPTGRYDLPWLWQARTRR